MKILVDSYRHSRIFVIKGVSGNHMKYSGEVKLDRLSVVLGRFYPASNFWRSKTAWAAFVTGAMLLIVACGGGSDSDSTPSTPASTSTEPAGQMFDAEGNPIDESQTGTQPIQRGEDAVPDFELALFSNNNHTRDEHFRLSDLTAQGRPSVVNFWFPSCPPCVAEMPDLEAAFQKHVPDGVEFVGVQLVGLDSINDGQKFVDRLEVNYALGPDEEADIVRAYKITGFPTTFFLDKDQNIVKKWQGSLNAEKIEEFIQLLLN